MNVSVKLEKNGSKIINEIPIYRISHHKNQFHFRIQMAQVV